MSGGVGFGADDIRKLAAAWNVNNDDALDGVRLTRLTSWKTARTMLADLKPTPSEVLTLAAYLAAIDDPADDAPVTLTIEGDEDEADEFAPNMLIDWSPLVRVLRRLPP